MHVEAYDPTKHREQVDQWCAARKMRPIPAGWLPSTGLIVDGVAAVWLYRSDSAIIFVEGLISNPDASMITRARATEALLERAGELAAEMGARYVVGTSSHRSILEGATARGWNVVEPSVHLLIKECA